MNKYRPVWAEINLNNLYHNYLEAQKNAPNKTVIPVIKANAYGHGAVEIMQFLYDKGVSYFAVSLLEEALELRKINSEINILMLGAILKEDLIVASNNNIEITLYDEDIVNDVIVSNIFLTCHFKVDTGMHRYGINDFDIALKLTESLQNTKHLYLKGVFTHFATSDDNEEFYYKQLNVFSKFIDKLKTKPEIIHISNSSAIFKYEKNIKFTNAVRLGISLYGLTLEKTALNLKPVMQLKTKIVQVKTLKKGECVSYSQTFCAEEDMKIAILPIGYGDGFIRANKNGDVEINNKRYKLIGNICMDASIIKIDNEITKLTEVTIFGGLISADEVADRTKTINYEVTTILNKRIFRTFSK